MAKLQVLIDKFKRGLIAPHVYVTDGASRDPECSVSRCRWSWSEHLDPELLEVVKESVSAEGGKHDWL